MSIYRINVSAIKQLAAIEFNHHCNRVRHPTVGATVMERIGLGQVATQLAQEQEISQRHAMDFIMTAWQAEGHDVINRWDVRAIAALTNAVPTVLPAKYRKAAIRAIEQNEGGEWVVQFDSDVARKAPDRAPTDGFELIALTRGLADLQESLNARVLPLIEANRTRLVEAAQSAPHDEPQEAPSP